MILSGYRECAQGVHSADYMVDLEDCVLQRSAVLFDVWEAI
jgi:hypothetical protein